MLELTDILSKASANIPEEYFHLKIDGGDSIYRERVYCYELYHQIRSIWPNETPYYLNGEIDKSAHPILRKIGADNVKPDFLIHQPGYMSGNYAIIEVKKEGVDKSGLKKDLKTLSLFLSTVGYERGIYLIYGKSIKTDILLQKLTELYNELELSETIEIWVHYGAGQPAEQIKSLGV